MCLKYSTKPPDMTVMNQSSKQTHPFPYRGYKLGKVRERSLRINVDGSQRTFPVVSSVRGDNWLKDAPISHLSTHSLARWWCFIRPTLLNFLCISIIFHSKCWLPQLCPVRATSSDYVFINLRPHLDRHEKAFKEYFIYWLWLIHMDLSVSRCSLHLSLSSRLRVFNLRILIEMLSPVIKKFKSLTCMIYCESNKIFCMFRYLSIAVTAHVQYPRTVSYPSKELELRNASGWKSDKQKSISQDTRCLFRI